MYTHTTHSHRNDLGINDQLTNTEWSTVKAAYEITVLVGIRGSYSLPLYEHVSPVTVTPSFIRCAERCDWSIDKAQYTYYCHIP